jgi:ATP-dependent DNA helicase RecQ
MAQMVDQNLEALLPKFGLAGFRTGQREVIEAVMAGEDCLCVMPTGGGKSLCYQLPAVAREGLTLVVSPLISLMKDQVDQLQALGLRATLINSTLEPAEQYARLEQMSAGEFDLVYCAAERFRSAKFISAVQACRLQLLAIDEAHCISEWGHDFRPDYAKLGRFRARLGNPPTIALTATATDLVRRDIIEQLGLKNPRTFVTGFARPNLKLEVQSPTSMPQKDELLVDFINANPGSGIIYVSSRKRCEELSEMVRERTGRRTGMYHAGMQSEDRRRAQDQFMSGRAEIVVATTAFGMGIDKPDVRFVVHYNLPGTLEAYYQEAGRAGRDGLPSRCLLLFSVGDRMIQEFFIESAFPSRDAVAQVYNFLRAIDVDPIELTQQEIKEQLGLQLSTEGVGACERLLEKAGVLERLEPRQNMALVRIDSDLPTLVDMLPRQAVSQRRLLQAVERLVGSRRNEMVYFHPRELAAMAEMELPAMTRALRELCNLKAFDYVPPFRGRAVHMLERSRPFSELEIDFETMERRKAEEYDKLERVIRFARTKGCRQLDILHYFGQRDGEPCGHCDNCQGTPGGQASGWATLPADPVLVETVRKALSGVARTHGRFGKLLIAQMLCGSTTSKVTKFRLDRLSTYGVLSHLNQTDVGSLLDALMAAGCLEQVEIDRFRPLVQLTELGAEVMRGRAELPPISLPPEVARKLQPRPPKAARNRSGAGDDRPAPAALPAEAPRNSTDTPQDQSRPRPDPALLQRLQQWRRDVAADARLPAYCIVTGAALEDLARIRPTSAEGLLEIKGIGLATVEKHGAAILRLIADSSPDPPASAPNDLPSGTGVSPVEQQRDAGATSLAADAVDFGHEEGSREPAATGASQPAHYWTWRLLQAGFTPDECAAIRGLDPAVVLDHALRALDAGWQVSAAAFLSAERLRVFDEIIGPADPNRIRPLLAQLPRGTRYEEVQLYLKCRKQGCVSEPTAAR